MKTLLYKKLVPCHCLCVKRLVVISVLLLGLMGANAHAQESVLPDDFYNGLTPTFDMEWGFLDKADVYSYALAYEATVGLNYFFSVFIAEHESAIWEDIITRHMLIQRHIC